MSVAEANRPLELATRSVRWMGILSVVVGLKLMIFWGMLNQNERFGAAFFAMGLVVWFAPGAIFLVCEIFLIRRRRWAVIGAIITSVVQAVFALGCVVASVTMPPVSPIPIILSVLWVAALAQMIHHLRRSLTAVELDADHRHGFEVEALAPRPQPVLPIDAQEAEATT